MGFNGHGGIQLLTDAVALVGCCGGARYLALGEDDELVALLATAEDDIPVAISFEFKGDLAKYCCYVVLAHALEIGQAQK